MDNKNTLITNIGLKLKSYRIQKNLSVNKLSELANVSDQTIMNLENGKANNLSILTLHKIADAICLPISFFFTERNMYLEDTSQVVSTINTLINNDLLFLNVKDSQPILEFHDKYLYNYYKYTLEYKKRQLI